MKAQAEKILLVHTQGGMGDLLLSSPIAEALHELFPGCSVVLWCKPGFQPLFHHHPFINGFFAMQESMPFFEGVSLLKGECFDRVLFPWSTGRQAWMAALAGIPLRAGQSGRLLYSFLYNHPVRVRSAFGDTESHWVDIQLDYARVFGHSGGNPKPFLIITSEEKSWARDYLSARQSGQSRQLCGLHVCKGMALDSKRWPLAPFIAIGKRLINELNLNIVLTGSADEQQLVEEVCQGIGSDCAINLAGQLKLRQTAAIISTMNLMICPDTGIGHLAAALDVPVVSIFALKSDFPSRWRPYGVPYRIIRPDPIQCESRCIKETCQIFNCLLDVDIDQVIALAKDLLRETHKQGGY